jgi:hypothetical protein
LARRILSAADSHGHGHAGFGREGRHFNVASGGLQKAMILDLVTLGHRVIA